MTSNTVLRVRLVISLLLFAFPLCVAYPQTSTQDERARQLKVKRVGALPENVARGEIPDLWAVIIGVSRYQFGDQNLDGNQITNLKNAADDAQAIYDYLKTPEGGLFRDVEEGGHMILLKDEKATKTEVEKALNMLKQAKPKDYFVLYIAAHGMILPYRAPGANETTEVPYFVLYDTDLREPHRTALKMETFQRTVSDIPAKRGLVLSDTCHSGGVQLAGRDTSNTSIRANARYIDEMEKVATGVGFISAADQLEQSFERDDLNMFNQGQGVFTYCLLQGLAGDADTNFDGTVTFNEISSYLRDEVPKLTSNKQHPKSNTTALEANKLPLSVVSYADISAGNNDQYGLLVIRTPDVDGVEVSIDGKRFDTFNTGAQRAVMVKAGTRSISFSKGEMKRDLRAAVEVGKPKVVEVNLTFSESDDDALVEPSDKQVAVYFRDNKEPSASAKESFLNGVEAFNKQRFAESIDLFTRAIAANGGSYADAFVYQGRAEQSLGRKAAAIASFRKALAARPTDFETQTLLAEARFNAGDNVDEIIRELRSIIKRHPNFDFARVVYGDVLLSRKDFIGAEQQLRRAITINPKSPPAYLIMADILTYQDNSEKQKRAAESAERALLLLNEVSRKQTSVSKGLKRLSFSHVLFGGGKYRNESALAEVHHILGKALTRVVYLDDTLTNPDTYLDRARPHIQEAIKLAEGLTDKDRLALVLETSAMNHFLKGNLLTAITDGERSLKVASAIPYLKDYANAHLTLASAYASDQRFANAVIHLEKFLEVAGSQLPPSERTKVQGELDRMRRLKDANQQKPEKVKLGKEAKSDKESSDTKEEGKKKDKKDKKNN